ncbi:hypothetical protein ACC705_02475 [Rhizobium ruizarguesonis]
MQVILSLTFVAAMSAVSSQVAATDYAVVSEKVNPVMQPKGVPDIVVDCLNNTACAALAEAAAAYVGVPPDTVSGGAALVSVDRAGEEGRYVIRLPAGYQYCRSTIQTISVVPATGDRASVMGASSIKEGVSVYTWTPKRNLGEGETWIEADYTIIGVREDIADAQRVAGRCKPYGRTIISCRGASGTNKGQPSCGTVKD